MRTRLLCMVGLAVTVLSLGVVIPQAQAFTFFDDFESYASGASLTGYTAPNGQVWETPPSPAPPTPATFSLLVGDYGVGGSKDAGETADPTDGRTYANELPLGVELTTGVLTVQADLYKAHGDYENCAVHQQFGLKDSYNGTTVQAGWHGQYGPNGNDGPWRMYVYVDGGGFSGKVALIGPSVYTEPTYMHIVMTIDMATKYLTVTYYDDRGHSGTIDAGVITPLYGGVFEKPDTLAMNVYHRNQWYGRRGFDNVGVTDDPPTGTLKGTVTFQDATADPELNPVRVKLMQSGVLKHTAIAALDANRAYSIAGCPSGTFDAVFEASGFGRGTVSGVVIPPNFFSNPCNPSLPNGDVDRDYEMTTTDMSIVLQNAGLIGDE